MGPGETRIRKRHWRRDATNRCCYVPVGLAGCNGIIRFTVVEQDVPPLLPVRTMRTLQCSLDLTDDGDKVIFRQSGGESPLRTLQSGRTIIRADQKDPDGWQLPEVTELRQNDDEGCATNYMSVIAHVYQKTRGLDDDTPAGNHERDVQTSSRLRPVPERVMTTWNTTDDQTVLHCNEGSNGRCRTRRAMLRIFWRLSGCAAKPHREATGESVEEGAERLRSSTDCDPEGRQRCDVLRTMRDVCESVAAHSPDHGGTGS